MQVEIANLCAAEAEVLLESKNEEKERLLKQLRQLEERSVPIEQ